LKFRGVRDDEKTRRVRETADLMDFELLLGRTTDILYRGRAAARSYRKVMRDPKLF